MLYKHLLDILIEKEVVTASFAHRDIYLPSLCDFLFADANKDELKSHTQFDKHAIAITSIASGTYLFDHTNESNIIHLQKCTKSHILPLLTSTQHVESKMKDMSLCKTVSCSELTITCLRNVSSHLIYEITKSNRDDADYIQRLKIY